MASNMDFSENGGTEVSYTEGGRSSPPITTDLGARDNSIHPGICATSKKFSDSARPFLKRASETLEPRSVSSAKGKKARFGVVSTSPQDDEIAIIGIACRTAGADNQWEFWRLLENQECHVGDVPSDRWNTVAYSDSKVRNGRERPFVQKGGFLKDVWSFDNLLYRISDYEAAQIDPQQFILLECTTMALEDAGITRRDLAGSRTGVYIGGVHHDYATTFVGQVSTVDQYTVSGITNTILASRLSYEFDLRGPCMVLDTACSVSMVAIHQSCLAIRSGDCDMAICGGVNCILTPHIFMLLSEAWMISPTGQCKAFSKDADGYTRAEGCGVLILKRLKDAIRDGNKIYATVYTGTNQDGRTVTPMLQPSGQQQLNLLRDVYSRHNVDVTKIQYFEAHGAGTPVGDPVEANALGTFLKEKGHKGTVYMGSVKTNIGHTEAAAGILGVIKILLMMRHNKIVPSLHCDEVNPKINLTDLGLKIPREVIHWDSKNKIAGCNSFGFGGSNGHAIIKECNVMYDQQIRVTTKPNYHLVCFSGNTKRSVKGSLRQFIEDPQVPSLNLPDVSYTSTKCRDHYAFRAAFAAKDMAELLMAVKEKLDKKQWLPCGLRPKIVYVFCGMSTAWNGMCREMLDEMPAFKEVLIDVDKHLRSHVEWSLVHRLQTENPCDDPILAPVAIFACQVGLVAMWKKMGIKPDCLLGQSIGEIAAAYTSDCISLADAVSIIYLRSQLLAQYSGHGEMIVVKNIEVEKVRMALDDIGEKNASIALEYSPHACAISADSASMARIKPHLLFKLMSTNAQVKLISLDVTVPYHSPLVDSAAEELIKRLRQVRSSAPQIRFVSTVTGDVVTDRLDVKHWGDNIRKPVLFHQAVVASVSGEESEKVIFLELGPKPVLQYHISDLFPHKPYIALASISPQSEMKCCMDTLVSLYENGIDFEWTNFLTSGRKLTDIPRYCFDRADNRVHAETELAFCGGYDILGKHHLFVFAVSGPNIAFRALLSPYTICSIRQHMVMGRNVVPGALYAECGFAVARYMGMPHCSVSVNFHQILIMEKDEVADVEVNLHDPEAVKGGRQLQFEVSSKRKHHATIILSKYSDLPKGRINLKYLLSKLTHKAPKDKIRSVLRKLGFEHGPAFSLLEEGFTDFKEECLATMKLHHIDEAELQATIMHPCIIDCMLQATTLLSSERITSSNRALPKSFGSLVVFGRFEQTMYVHAKLKSKTPKQLIYDLKLLSKEGYIIAELANFVLQVFSSVHGENDNSTPGMLTNQWSHVKNICFDNSKSYGAIASKNSTVVIFEGEISSMSDTIRLINLDFNKDISMIENELREQCRPELLIDSLLILFPDNGIEDQAADVIQSKVVSMCLLIQSIFNILNERELQSRVLITLLTVGAFPSVCGKDIHDVNPVATALWGLLRVALHEHAYANFRAVELQISGISKPTHCISVLPWLLHLLADEKVAGFSEILVSDNAMFVNYLVQDTSTLEVPCERKAVCVDIKDVPDNVVFVYNAAADVSNVKAVSMGPPKVNDTKTSTVEVESFVQPAHHLLPAKNFTQHMLPQNSKPSDCLVMATEVCGYLKGKANCKISSCCPVVVGPEVVVSFDTTFECSLFPNYQVGDSSRLAVLWDIKNKMTSCQKCTILASQETLPIAKALKLLINLSNNSDLDGDSRTDIMLIEDLRRENTFSPYLLSLVFMDCEIISAVSRCWVNAVKLISCSFLFNAEIQAYMAYNLPNTEIDLIDTQLIFQQANLKNAIPQILKLSQIKSDLITEITKCLHETSACEDYSDIRALLQFQSFRLSDMSVHLTNDTLFLKNGIYIVVGGLTGLGWLCVKFLAENNAGHIAIINRRSASEEQVESMNDVSLHYECKVKSFEADVSDIRSLKRAFDTIDSLWKAEGKLRGIFMGAAVIRDGAFILMNRSYFEDVLAPKVKGAWNLHILTKHIPLDYFVMHSSVTSVLGNQGQANYAAGNAFLDGLAFHRRHMGLAAQTINWGPLDTGLLANKDQLKESMKNMGFPVASSADIMHMLKILLLLNKTQTVPVRINRELFSQYINNNALTPLKKRLQLLIDVSLHTDEQDNNGQDFSAIRSLSPEQRRLKYEQFLSKLVARVLGVDPSMVTRKANLVSLGLNSVSAMTLISKIEWNTKYRLAAVDFLSADVSISTVAIALEAHVSQSS